MYKSIQKTLNFAILLGFMAVPCAADVSTSPIDPKNAKDYFTISQIEIEEFDGEDTLLTPPLRSEVISLDWDIGIPNPNPAPLPPQYGTPGPYQPAPTPVFNPNPIFRPGPYETFPPVFTPAPSISNNAWDLNQIVVFGKAIWDIILSNQAVVDVKIDKVDVLPEGSKRWTDLQGWTPPKTRSYKIIFRNLLGLPVVNVGYRVIYTTGGNQAGVGKFLSNVTVTASDISVFWGFDFGLNVSIANVTNAGSTVDPMAAVELLVQWKVSSIILSRQGSYSYYVRGDGYYKNL